MTSGTAGARAQIKLPVVFVSLSVNFAYLEISLIPRQAVSTQ